MMLKMFLLGFAVAWAASAVGIWLSDEFNGPIQILKNGWSVWFFQFPVFIVVVASVPFRVVWHFFHLLVAGAPADRFERTRHLLQVKHLFGNCFYCRDTKARKITHRRFLVRVKKEKG